MRTESARPLDNGGWLHRLNGSVVGPRNTTRTAPVKSATIARADIPALATRYQSAVPSEELQQLAHDLGVTVESLQRLNIGWDGRAWTFPMVNAERAIVGIRRRFADGKKLSVKGGREGVFVPGDLSEDGPLLICEGPTDTAALLGLGFDVIGRPSCTGGVKIIPEIVKGRDVVIVADVDADKAGQRGAVRLASALLAHCPTVRLITPPEGIKDARAWKRAGATREDVETLANAADILKPEPEEEKKSEPTQAVKLIELATNSVTLFHTPGAEDHSGAFADIVSNKTRQTVKVKSPRFRLWLQQAFFKANKKPPTADALKQAVDHLIAKAIYQGEEREVFLRTAGTDGTIWIDLCDDEYHVVKITAEGWTVENSVDVPVRFARRRGMRALPVPGRGGNLADLRGLLNVPSDDDWCLLLAWLVAALRPTGPYTVLCINGEQGSAKSTLCRIVRRLVDPNGCELRRPPNDERDLMIAAQNAWIVSLDNMSKLRPGLSDCLCVVASGGGFATRELYSDDDEKLFTAQRPIMLNGIANVAIRGDLADRSIVLSLPTIPEHRRREEADVLSRFEVMRPRFLGALLDGVSAALRNLDGVRLGRLPRSADFARWATAAESGLGLAPGSFMAAHATNRAASHEEVIEASAIGPGIMALVRGEGEWIGTAGDLLAVLTERVDDATKHQRDWPSKARGLAGQLRRLAPALRACGVAVEPPDPEDKTRTYRLTLQGGDSTAHTARTAQDGLGDAENTDSCRAVDGRLDGSVGGLPPKGETNRPSENSAGATDNVESGRLGGSGGCVPPPNGQAKGLPHRAARSLHRPPDRDANGETAMDRADRWRRERKAVGVSAPP